MESVVTKVLVQGCLIAAGHPLAAVLVNACAAELLGPLLNLLLAFKQPFGMGGRGWLEV